MPNRRTDVEAINAALALLSTITVRDLIAVHKVHKDASTKAIEALREAGGGQLIKTYEDEQRRLRKNRLQQEFRATPEGKKYANDAARKSIAAKKKAEDMQAILNEHIARHSKENK